MRSRLFLIIFSLICMFVLPATSANAGGVSIDAGLTPAKDRWILRTQMRYMQRKNDPSGMGREMVRYAFPVVLAYGFRPNLTLMLRQTVIRQEMLMTEITEKSVGFGDLFVFAKFRAYRINTPRYTFGIAPIVGLEVPIGNDSFTSETWNLNSGIYLSGRRGSWATDFNIAYAWNGFTGNDKKNINPGDELSLDWALAYQINIGRNANLALAPVIELSYKYIWQDQLGEQNLSNTGERVFYLSPGSKFSTSSFILEMLVQIPVWQYQKGFQLNRNTGILIGSRFMF